MPRAVMIELDYARLAAAPVATDPFPHVVVPGFVPPASLEAVLADLPPLGQTRLISGGFRQAWSPRRGVDGGDGRICRCVPRSSGCSGLTCAAHPPW